MFLLPQYISLSSKLQQILNCEFGNCSLNCLLKTDISMLVDDEILIITLVDLKEWSASIVTSLFKAKIGANIFCFPSLINVATLTLILKGKLKSHFSSKLWDSWIYKQRLHYKTKYLRSQTWVNILSSSVDFIV